MTKRGLPFNAGMLKRGGLAERPLDSWGDPYSDPMCDGTYRAPLWLRITFAFLMAGAIIMGGCASKTNFDCSIWSSKDADIRAKRDYCFPDCPSCGPVIRQTNPYEGLKRDGSQ